MKIDSHLQSYHNYVMSFFLDHSVDYIASAVFEVKYRSYIHDYKAHLYHGTSLTSLYCVPCYVHTLSLR